MVEFDLLIGIWDILNNIFINFVVGIFEFIIEIDIMFFGIVIVDKFILLINYLVEIFENCDIENWVI